ncbi:hypothetical protein [Piscinibacter sp. HJYY11]|uniref:hypothetical protein n=1 Tax=Piscinibacter sp. HJYY11 TaxID=2801333 RepID=UPI00191E3EE8|nr:hypothetical protein [Piscinibacter sp. HJYY11]MBL0728416.1 hypothetical protein [Piscinibacter sp. HJYY11]
MLNLKTLVFGALIAAASAGAMARPMEHDRDRFDDIDARQARQAARIDAALHDGRLSRREYRALQREQAAIRRYEAQAKADGFLSRAERRDLEAMLDRASRHIRNS